ncbi:MAG: hypothetical protein LBF40_03060 [Deltaproteobacteria bacterium]|nr:hypothetical protein [Deltaproteobacteria bacterium]
MTVDVIKDIKGNEYKFDRVVDPKKGLGKTIYFTTDGKFAISFFADEYNNDENIKRLQRIIYYYSDKIFTPKGGKFFKDIFCWPICLIHQGNLLATVSPVYPDKFFFRSAPPEEPDSILGGALKEPFWFASSFNLNSFVPKDERGDLLGILNVCLNLSRGIDKLHQFDLLPANLSFNNCIIDPLSGSAIIKEISHLIIPDYPSYLSTLSPEFLAPELVAVRTTDPNAKVRYSKETNRHALALLIYYFLFHRHALLGTPLKIRYSSVYKKDENDVNLFKVLGKDARFFENLMENHDFPPQDQNVELSPWNDHKRLPYTVIGTYLSQLFEKSFVDGLHAPSIRPLAADWIKAIVRTRDLLYPCSNPDCPMHWFVLDDKFTCPYCDSPITDDSIPKIQIFPYDNKVGTADNFELVVHHNRYLYQWHVNPQLFPNEFLTEGQKKPVGYFSFYKNKWFFVNQSLEFLHYYDDNQKPHHVQIGKKLDITDNLILSLYNGSDGYFAKFQILRPQRQA